MIYWAINRKKWLSVSILTLKVPITTAAKDILISFVFFRENKTCGENAALQTASLHKNVVSRFPNPLFNVFGVSKGNLYRFY